MITYELNLEADAAVDFKVAGWIPDLMQRVLTHKGFMAAHWYFRNPEDEDEDKSKKFWTLHFMVEDRKNLDEFIANQEEAILKQAREKFGDKFAAFRRVLNLLNVAGPAYEQLMNPGQQSSK